MSGRTIIAGTVALLALIAGAALYLVVAADGGERPAYLVNIGRADLGGPFTLTATDGRQVTDSEVIDRPALLYFGYTWCPDICPVDAANMAEAADILAEKGIAIRPVFISVDPERDTPEALGDYVSVMHPEMVGLTGPTEDLKELIRAYGGYFERVNMPDSAMGYLMQHTGFIYLVLPETGLEAIFRQGTSPENLAAEIERILG